MFSIDEIDEEGPSSPWRYFHVPNWVCLHRS